MADDVLAAVYYIVYSDGRDFLAEPYFASTRRKALLYGMELACSKGLTEFILEDSGHKDIFQGEIRS